MVPRSFVKKHSFTRELLSNADGLRNKVLARRVRALLCGQWSGKNTHVFSFLCYDANSFQ